MHLEADESTTRPAYATDARLLRRGVRLEILTIAYNILEGVVAIAAGWIAGSIALVGFGIDSAIETTSAVVVLLRLLRTSISGISSPCIGGHAPAPG